MVIGGIHHLCWQDRRTPLNPSSTPSTKPLNHVKILDDTAILLDICTMKQLHPSPDLILFITSHHPKPSKGFADVNFYVCLEEETHHNNN